MAQLQRASLGEHALATLWEPPDEPVAVDPGAQLVVSRFAWLRRHMGGLIAETSLGPRAVSLEDPRAVALLHELAAPGPVDTGLADRVGLPLQAVRDVVALLVQAGVVVDAARARQEDEPPLAVWEFHDLLFHARSRHGRSVAPAGGTYRFAGRFPIAPAIPAPRGGGAEVPLRRPDWEAIERSDPPLAAAQSRRTSTRRYGEQPLTVEQVSELLYRVGRVDDLWTAPSPSGPEVYVAKPYPSGGGLYELELHLVVRTCRGLEPGLYHYAADRHALETMAGFDPEVERLLADAAAGMGIAPDAVPTLIVLTARMGRLAWKYQSLAYSLVLKHVGVVLQTVYLSAAAMGIGACAVGAGDIERFSRASGLDPHEEASVGEIALGSRPTGSRPPGSRPT